MLPARTPMSSSAIFRRLREQPILFWGVTVSLALALGCGIAIVSVQEASTKAALGQLPGGRIVLLWSAPRAGGHLAVGPADLVDWRNRASCFTGLAGFVLGGPPTVLVLPGEQAVGAEGAVVTPDLFSVLGVHPFLGSVPQEARSGSAPLILSYSAWKGLFGARRDLIGRKILVGGANGALHTIAAVMPEGFRFPFPLQRSPPQFWTLISLAGAATQPRDARGLGVVGRLRRGVQLGAARAQMNAIAADLAAEYPADRGLGIGIARLETEADPNARAVMRASLWALAVAAIVAWLNMAILLAVDLDKRRSQIAIRYILGARPFLLWRGLVAENSLLAALA